MGRPALSDEHLHQYRRKPPARAYCAGLIEVDPISRVSLVTQLICRFYWLGVRV